MSRVTGPRLAGETGGRLGLRPKSTPVGQHGTPQPPPTQCPTPAACRLERVQDLDDLSRPHQLPPSS
jgi:hypothetical protein